MAEITYLHLNPTHLILSTMTYIFHIYLSYLIFLNAIYCVLMNYNTVRPDSCWTKGVETIFTLPTVLKEEEICFGVRHVSDNNSPMSAPEQKQFSDHKAVVPAKSQTSALTPLIEVPHWGTASLHAGQCLEDRLHLGTNTALQVKLFQLRKSFMLFNPPSCVHSCKTIISCRLAP